MAERTADEDPDRPTALLPLGQLVRLSVYWLGLVAVFQGIGIYPPGADQGPRPGPDHPVHDARRGPRSGRRSSPSSSSRRSARSATTRSAASGGASRTSSSGRRSTSIFLVGLATSNSIIAVAAFVVLLQFSSNFAQGPFQGYVPDLVPAPQVGLASGMVGLFTILGVVTGTALASLGLAIGGLHAPDDRPRCHRVRDDAVALLPARRGTQGEGSRRPELAVHRRRGVGHGHPARAQLPVPGRLALLHPRWQRVPDRPVGPVSRAGARDGRRGRARLVDLHHHLGRRAVHGAWRRSRPRASRSGSDASGSSTAPARSAPSA